MAERKSRPAPQNWRPRVYTEELCPRCGMLTGVQCRNYKGQNKAPCMLRVVRPETQRRRLVQQLLPGFAGGSATEEGM